MKFRNAFVVFAFFCSSQVVAQINIWQGEKHHKRVMIYPYIAPDSSAPAVIVCPGGSYFWHDMDDEGREVGEWLRKCGITAFVLRYRTAGVPAFLTHFRLIARGRRYPDAQDDLRQALRWVRAHTELYGLNADSVGAMGFSAGGHLVMSAAELFPCDERPVFVASIYPVVTMQEPYVHKRSRRALLGDNRKRNKAMIDSLSLEKHVQADSPLVFLVNCKDDPIVKYQNSVLLDSALSAAGVDHLYIQYETGGHGFGASETKGTAESRQWNEEFIKWFHQHNF
ncbi:MAG: alpha/beta hydrolase [Prevotellaceae bacterium]|nr:alpha/beta hydrolase [Prevotellaceae bacterium]